MDLASRSLRIVSSTWVVRASGAGTTLQDADLARFCSVSRCQLEPITQTPAEPILMNLLGIAINNILINSAFAPLVGPGFIPMPEVLQGLVALPYNKIDEILNRISPRTNFNGLELVPSAVSCGVPIVDLREPGVTVRKILGSGWIRVLCNVDQVTDVFNLNGIAGRIVIYEGNWFFGLDDGAAEAGQIPFGPDLHLTGAACDILNRGFVSIMSGEREMPLTIGVEQAFDGGMLSVRLPYHGFFDIDLLIYTNTTFRMPNGNLKSRRMLACNDETTILDGLIIPAIVQPLINALLIRLGIEGITKLNLALMGDYLRMMCDAIYFTTNCLNLTPA